MDFTAVLTQACFLTRSLEPGNANLRWGADY